MIIKQKEILLSFNPHNDLSGSVIVIPISSSWLSGYLAVNLIILANSDWMLTYGQGQDEVVHRGSNLIREGC